MIEIKNLTKTYKENKTANKPALNHISLTIEDGEMVAIMGKSGAGKSTLLHVIAGIDEFEEGIYELNGISMNHLNDQKRAEIRNEKIGIVMQDYALVDYFTVEENIMLPMMIGKKSKTEKKARVDELLEQIELSDVRKKKVNKLSGGQMQRVAIARALANNPNLIMADEPTGALDSETARTIMNIFRRLNEDGKTVVIVTHDQDVAEYCDRVIVLKDGEII